MQTKISLFKFGSDKSALKYDDLIVHISVNIASKAELLRTLSIGLNFPEYFGENWDALEECLRDLSWTNSKRIVIFHEGIPMIEPDQLQIYIQILLDCVEYWKLKNEHQLIVLFPPETKNAIGALILTLQDEE